MSNVSASEQRSKKLFGSKHLIDVARAIGGGEGPVESGLLQDQLSLPQSAVHRVLERLEGAGLLIRHERTAQNEPVRYSRTEHSFWAAADELHATAEAAA